MKALSALFVSFVLIGIMGYQHTETLRSEVVLQQEAPTTHKTPEAAVWDNQVDDYLSNSVPDQPTELLKAEGRNHRNDDPPHLRPHVK